MNTFSDFGIKIPRAVTGQANIPCPECSSQRKKKRAPCLSVNTDEGVWKCHHCGWAGSIAQGVDGGNNVLHWRKPKYRKPETIPILDLPPEMIAWFENRGISHETIKDNNISWKKIYMPQVEDIVNCIAFPYFRGGELINVKYRDKDKNFRLEAGAERCFYGIDDIKGEDSTVTIVEGEIDKLALWEAGIRTALSVPDGAPPVGSSDYSAKFNYLNDPYISKDKFSHISKFIIAVDEDEPGIKLEEELSRRLGKEKCLRVRWPEGTKDANEVLLKYGRDVLRECVEHAEPYPIEGTFEAKELSNAIDKLYHQGLDKGVSTGWHSMDRGYLVRPGVLTVVTGVPSSGKSNWIDAMMVNIAKNEGWNFAIFSPENQPLEDHMARILEKYIGSPFLDGPSQRLNADDLEQGKKWLTDHFTWILPNDDKEWSLDIILDAAKGLVLKKGIRGLVIDPWNELEHNRANSQTETEYISQALKRVRQFARRYGIHLWIVAHPAKLYRDKNGKIPIPTPYDISGSARWRDKADNCITVWRDLSNDDKCSVEIHVQKVRFRQDGRIGINELSYNWATGTYHETNRAVEEIPPTYDI
jgi:twinkle protein